MIEVSQANKSQSILPARASKKLSKDRHVLRYAPCSDDQYLENTDRAKCKERFAGCKELVKRLC